MSTDLATTETAVVQHEAFLPVMSFEQAVARRDVIGRLVKSQMKEGIDFGTIPGVAKPSLWKPGAEKLGVLFGLVAHYNITAIAEDWTGEAHGGEPFFFYQVVCELTRGGVAMGEGMGSCNSWETKYRYRKAERTCPECGKSAIIKGQEKYGGGWLCWKKKDGCGAKFKVGDKSIEGQAAGRKANEEVFDQVNTCLKMAKKRSFIDGMISTVGASEFFTQDVEDIAALNRKPNEAVLHGESHEELVARRVREEGAKLDKQRAGRATASPCPIPEPASDAVPPDVLAMWVRMVDFSSSCEELAGLKKSIVEAVGSDVDYYRILGEHNMKKANDMRGKPSGNARMCARALLEFLNKCTAEPFAEQPFEASDDDIPEALKGAVTRS